jgi:hypothetical protein
MNHLTDERIVDALEGALPDREAVHLRACAACEARVERLRGVLHDLPAVDVPEPSPLFWNHFGAQVNASVDAAPKHRSRWLTTAALAWMGAAAVVILAVIGLYESSTAKLVPPVGITQAPIDDAATAGTETPTDPDVETDEAWAVVRSLPRTCTTTTHRKQASCRGPARWSAPQRSYPPMNARSWFV